MHLKVAAHAHGARGILAATNAGIDSIEHGTFLDEAGARAMKAHGTYYSATLMAFSGVQALLGTGKLTPAMEAKARDDLRASGARASTSPIAPASRSRSARTARSLRTARPTRNWS